MQSGELLLSAGAGVKERRRGMDSERPTCVPDRCGGVGPRLTSRRPPVQARCSNRERGYRVGWRRGRGEPDKGCRVAAT